MTNTFFPNTNAPMYAFVQASRRSQVVRKYCETHRGQILEGVPAAPGYYKGRACVLNHPIEEASLKRGDVLFVKQADVSWTHLIERSEGS